MYPVNLNQQKSKIDFQARQAASVITNVNNIRKEIQLYQLDNSDIPFAKRMLDCLDLKKLHPNTDNYSGFVPWKNIIKGAVTKIGIEDVFLAVNTKRPCGVLAYFDDSSKYTILSRLASWPIKPDNKPEHIGKSLMRILFQHAKDNNIKGICLIPAECKPNGKTCKTFYSFLGFKAPPQDSFSSHWLLEDIDFGSKCAQLDNFFEYKKIDNATDVDLNSELCLRFEDTLLEKTKALCKSLVK